MSQGAALARFIAECHHGLKFCCFSLLMLQHELMSDIMEWSRLLRMTTFPLMSTRWWAAHRRERVIAQEPRGLACRHCQRKAMGLWKRNGIPKDEKYFLFCLFGSDWNCRSLSCFWDSQIFTAHKEKNILWQFQKWLYQGFFLTVAMLSSYN